MKIAIAGGYGVGKTTFVSSISDIVPLTTEAAVTAVSGGVDEVGHNRTKTTTTVAMDFGRIALDDELVLYLFGTPGQDRFHFLWDELTRGAIGAVVLVDTRTIESSFTALDYVEAKRIPFVVGVNCFYGVAAHTVDEVREALTIRPEVPVQFVDARDRESTKRLLVELTRHALSLV